MSDLISRSALIAEYDRVHKGPAGGARKLMEDAPDAAVYGSYNAGGYCSVCKAPMPTDSREDYISEREVHYCYYCGARMEGTNG